VAAVALPVAAASRAQDAILIVVVSVIKARIGRVRQG
jgi:hypothetical protein